MGGVTVHLLCGLNGAGKSTLALTLARDLRAVRLSLDERMIRCHPTLNYAEDDYGVAAGQERENLWREARTALAAGSDVVLDWNCWRAADRASWSRRARACGADVVVHWVDVTLGAALRQSTQRNASAPDPTAGRTSHQLRDSDVRALAALFEPPDATEGLALRRYRSETGTAGGPSRVSPTRPDDDDDRWRPVIVANL